MTIPFSSLQDKALIIAIRSDMDHKRVLDALAAIRPLTADPAGLIVMEALDYRTLVPEKPADALRGC